MKKSSVVSKTACMGVAFLALSLVGCKEDITGPQFTEDVRSYTFQVKSPSLQPVGGATAAIRLPGQVYQGITDQNGTVCISIPSSVTLPEFVVVTVDHRKYMPEAVAVPGGQNSSVTRSVTCTSTPSRSLVREVKLHHLGDNRYGGDPNSQLQMSSEGTRMTFQFTLSSVPSTMPYIRLYGRGIQYGTKIKINGVQVTTLNNSPSNGDLGCYSGLLSGTASLRLHTGTNTFELETGYDASIKDYDDIEFCSLLLYYK
jgi:hypothetical protein